MNQRSKTARRFLVKIALDLKPKNPNNSRHANYWVPTFFSISTHGYLPEKNRRFKSRKWFGFESVTSERRLVFGPTFFGFGTCLSELAVSRLAITKSRIDRVDFFKWSFTREKARKVTQRVIRQTFSPLPILHLSPFTLVT